MATTKPRGLLRLQYEEAAEAYLRSLTLENIMEGTAQATQREITLESLALVRARRRDVHYYNELLLQYPLAGQTRLGQVVADNMVVKYEGTIEANGSYDLPFQPVGPFWVMEYVSKSSKRKDYEDNFKKYEQELQVPYYLLFYPQTQDLTLYRLEGGKYVTVLPNAQGRYPVPELDLEVALRDGWVRYWSKGELLPLPAELDRVAQEATHRAEEAAHRAEEATHRAEEESRLREQAERLAADEKRAREQAERLAQEAEHRAEEERQARLALEQRLAQLEAQLKRPPSA
jgi:Uma2 family endonuclease